METALLDMYAGWQAMLRNQAEYQLQSMIKAIRRILASHGNLTNVDRDGKGLSKVDIRMASKVVLEVSIYNCIYFCTVFVVDVNLSLCTRCVVRP